MTTPTLKLVTDDERVERLSDVKVPDKFFRRVRLDPVLDQVFGSSDSPGLMPGSTTLLTGAPGAGKSTMCLQLADMLQAAGQRVLYNIGEENRYMVKLRADRLGVSAQYHVSQKATADELIAYVLEHRFTVLFQDSLQTLHDPSARGATAWVVVADKLQRLSKEHDVTVIVVGQCTKGGAFMGPNRIKHDLDGHLHLDLKGGERSLAFDKNRFGDSGIPWRVELTARGITFQGRGDDGRPSDPTDPSPAGGARPQHQARSRGEGKRQDVMAVAMDRLLAGSMVSGYTYQDLGLDCSGGFWRAQVAAAVAELRRQGYGVGERKVGGRAHQFINLWKKG
jgi:hypothetical protein